MILQEKEPNAEFADASLSAFKSAVGLLEDAVRNIRKVWDGLLMEIEKLYAAIRRGVEDSWFGQVVDWFTDDLQEGLDTIAAGIEAARVKVTDMLKQLEQAIRGSIPVESLFTVGIDWSTKVNMKLSRITPEVKQSGGIDTWHGPAHDTYRIREEEQEGAVDHSVEAVKELSKWLADVGEANVQFVTELMKLAGDVVAQIVETSGDVAVVAGTADVLSAQETVNDLSATLGRFAANIMGCLAAVGNRLAQVLSQVTKVAAEYSDSRDFPLGGWPKAVNA